MEETDRIDWSSEDDYNPEDAEWINITLVGSSYYIQADTTKANHFRYRSKIVGSFWKKGKPPVERIYE